MLLAQGSVWTNEWVTVGMSALDREAAERRVDAMSGGYFHFEVDCHIVNVIFSGPVSGSLWA